MSSYASDYAFGSLNQQRVRLLLNERFGGDHIEQPRYATFDFISSDGKRLVEVKSRRCSARGYPYALVGGNKVDVAFREHPNKTIIFVWVYADEILFIEYSPDEFDTFRRGMYQRGARDGIRDQPADTVWVPISNLESLRIPEAPSSTNNMTPSPQVVPLPTPSLVLT